jgi:1,4-alpha-glucan branching enzyme
MVVWGILTLPDQQLLIQEMFLMKNNRKTVQEKLPQVLPVHFEFSDAAAHSVAIAGTFNEWQPNSTPMIALRSGRWIKNLVLPPGTYEYCLVVDGKWMTDTRAKEAAPNPYGGLNSVVKVGNPMQRQVV